MKTKVNPTFEAKLYIGSRQGYNGPKITAKQLKTAIKMYQHRTGLDNACPVRLTRTTYIWDDYEEKGWEIGIINYPRQPLGADILKHFALDLAEYLLQAFAQNRMSIVFPEETVMLEADNAEQKHK